MKTIQITKQSLNFNDIVCEVMTFRDITSQIELREAKEQNKMTELMISNVTHEYLTPIRCMYGLSTILHSNVDSEMQKHTKMI